MTTQDLDIFALPVHPAADIFPMLSDEELDDLAADIKANGLLQPIVIAKVEGAWTLVDGRNRREACRRAGVQLRVNDLNGTDPLAYIISANVHRRHLSKGQLAMAVACLLETSNASQQDVAKSAGVSQQRVSQARTVLRATPLVVDRVIAGTLKLDVAYKAAHAEAGRDRLERDADARLERRAPDLFVRYQSGELTRAEAEAIYADAEKEDRERRQDIFATTVKLLKAVRSAGGTAIRELPAIIADADHYAEFKTEGGDIAYDPDTLPELKAVFSTMLEVLGSLPPRQRSKRNGRQPA